MMFVMVDERPEVADAYVAAFRNEGIASIALRPPEFREWLRTTATTEIESVQSCLLGDFDSRPHFPALIRSRTRAPIIALEDVRSLDATLEMFTLGIDDVVRKPVHVKELVARSQAIWRRINDSHQHVSASRLKIFFDGRDIEVDGEPLPLPRRERHILEFLAKNAHRRVTKTQIFNAVYGPFEEKVDEIVVEGHVSKLRKKLRLLLGSDVIDAKRYLGYQFVGCKPASGEIPPAIDAPELAAEPVVEQAPTLAMA